MDRMTFGHGVTDRALSVEIAGRPLSAVLQEVERLYLSHAMTEAGGNKAEAARISGMSDDTFRKKIGRYQVKAIYSLA